MNRARLAAKGYRFSVQGSSDVDWEGPTALVVCERSPETDRLMLDRAALMALRAGTNRTVYVNYGSFLDNEAVGYVEHAASPEGNYLSGKAYEGGYEEPSREDLLARAADLTLETVAA